MTPHMSKGPVLITFLPAASAGFVARPEAATSHGGGGDRFSALLGRDESGGAVTAGQADTETDTESAEQGKASDPETPAVPVQPQKSPTTESRGPGAGIAAGGQKTKDTASDGPTGQERGPASQATGQPQPGDRTDIADGRAGPARGQAASAAEPAMASLGAGKSGSAPTTSAEDDIAGRTSAQASQAVAAQRGAMATGAAAQAAGGADHSAVLGAAAKQGVVPGVSADALPILAEAMDAEPAEVAMRDASSAARASVAATALQGVVTPRQIALQLIPALPAAADAPVEILLNPEELGRVALRMKSVGDSVTLVISAERPETSELIRKNLQDLAQEFRDLGYRSVDLSFEDRRGAAGRPGSPPDLAADSATDTPTPRQTGPGAGAAGSLDLRL